MKTPKHIGIIGITAEGASLCYRTIVSEATTILGKNKHPEISLHSFSFDDVVQIQYAKDWHKLSDLLAISATKLAQTGADFAVMPANSFHYAYELLVQKSPIPILSIVETVVAAASRSSLRKVAVLGVGMTMSDGLYEKPFQTAGIEPVIPSSKQQQVINQVIMEEIVPDCVTANSIQKVIAVIEDLKQVGCDGVGLCCTELPLIISSANSPLPILDSTRLLAKRAVEYALADDDKTR